MPWPKKQAQLIYHAQLGHPEEDHTTDGLVVCNSWDLEPFNLLNSLAPGC